MTTNATTQTTATDATPSTVAIAPKLVKTATITLVSGGVTLTLRAHRLKAGAETGNRFYECFR